MRQIKKGREFLFNLQDLSKYLLNRNITLIGMSGAGKTTLATLLAKRYNKRFVDTDHIITEMEGMTINDIFARFGEEKFRLIESECIRRVAGYKNAVISTGGGVVTREENMRVLKSSSFVIFLHREIDDIISNVDASRRPLLRNSPEKIKDIYYRRIGLYLEYADIIVYNSGDLSDLVNMVDRKLMDLMEVL